MKRVVALLLLCAAAASFASKSRAARRRIPLNNRPIVGVLTQELTPLMTERYGNHSSYVAASYVKFLEGAGARVVPVMIGQSTEYYEQLVKEMNGVLFPGGATYFDNPNGYADAGDELYKLALALNRAGDYFPVWGTCLGFELLTYVAAGRREHRTACNVNNEMHPLDFEDDYKDSRLFKNLPKRLANIMSSKDVMPHFHSWCVTEANLTALGIMNDWKVLASNKNATGDKYISVIESREYPFYGTIFHPEKIGYEWTIKENTVHDAAAIKVMEYFANFFVNEARKNSHAFKSSGEEAEALIYRYQPTYTGENTKFEQSYFFD